MSSRWHAGVAPVQRSFLPRSHALEPALPREVRVRTKSEGRASSLKFTSASECCEVWEWGVPPCVMASLRRRSRPSETRRGATSRPFGLDCIGIRVRYVFEGFACSGWALLLHISTQALGLTSRPRPQRCRTPPRLAKQSSRAEKRGAFATRTMSSTNENERNRPRTRRKRKRLRGAWKYFVREMCAFTADRLQKKSIS